MSDFVTRLVQRQLGQLATVEPRMPSLFASTAPASPAQIVEDVPAEEFGLPQSVNLPLRLVDSPPTGVAREREQSAASGVNQASDRSTMQQQEQTQGVNRPAEQTETRSNGRIIANVEQVRAVTRPLVERQVSIPGPSASVVLPVSTQIIFPGAPPVGRESQREQSRSARSAPQRLVEMRAATLTIAPPRLKTVAHESAAALKRDQRGEEPPVHVTIGRIEVTAVTTPPQPKRAPVPRKPSMSLDDYLARRQRRER
jgi:hypothetical protein